MRVRVVHSRGRVRDDFFDVLVSLTISKGHTILGGDDAGVLHDFAIVDEQKLSSRPQLIVQPALFGDTRQFRMVSWNRPGRSGIRPPLSREERPQPLLRPWKHTNTGPVVILGDELRDLSSEASMYAGVKNSWRREVVYLPSERTQRRLGTRRAHADEYLVRTNAWMTVSEQSAAAVQAVILGIPSVTLHRENLAYDVTSHSIAERKMPDRAEWAHWLSWQRFSLEEFADGTMMTHMMQVYGDAEADARQ